MPEDTRPTSAPPPPLIGVTTYLEPARWGTWVREAALLPAPYLRAVERSGGVPVLLPPAGRPQGLRTLVSRLDGIVFAGGGDVDPGRYGAEPHAETSPPQPHRDRAELALLRAVLEQNTPFLAICRGMHLLNVALGGTLVQHLPDQVGHDGHRPEIGRVGTHRVHISGSSALGGVLGATADVPTYHHQALDRVGGGLEQVAWADDKTVEAVELRGHPFGLAVQWHPEEGDDQRLFEALVAAASGGG
ncbi:gamma-glutamyl-gamma-aminobutyrate hydrolase family protein [Actinomadura flavalba]|uniref:gamma-glutamyl-gamma-aminobutyrate hydrolase family protein n=1 Tax=Actinomadura flavalba TaxID=1120938 RepID=UPI0003706D65|nr:gamma-glutamyl-gamma-aminobutyrate hydrolase family protein [Actinomadura flavalba]